jgi:SAM-dependent methyltransferase
MTKLTFNIDLSGYDTAEYEMNPIVSWNFDYLAPPIGRAKIAKDKKSVEVEFAPKDVYPFAGEISRLPLKLAESYQTGDMKPNKKRLLSLSAVPKLQTELTKIYLGSGEDHRDGYIHVDYLDLPNTDIVHNLIFTPYPFEDNSVDEVIAIDVVEHLPSHDPNWQPMIVVFMEEMHRIMKPGAMLFIQTPGYRAAFGFTDPTHTRVFTVDTFSFFDPDTAFGSKNSYYSKAKFKVESKELENGNLQIWCIKR